MHSSILATIAALGSTFAGPHGGGTTRAVQLEAWQVINLIGAPMLALLFLRPVIDDVKAWLGSLRQ